MISVRALLVIISVTCVVAAYGQNVKRLQPGKVYEPGSAIFSPRFGFKSTIPEGWSGVLPRESEVFLLSSLSAPSEIFVFGKTTGNLTSMKSDWEKGFEIEKGIRLESRTAVIKDEVLSGEVVATGSFIDKSKRGYAVARCGSAGTCVIGLAIMAAGVYDQAKTAADNFMLAAAFEAPSDASPYVDFDWRKFLAGKSLIGYAIVQGGSRETQVDLCADGTFSATVSKKGIFKNTNPKYKGKLTGDWTADGIGEEGVLVLDFKKDLPDVKVTLVIDEEKVTAMGERYFVAESQKCK